MMVHLGDPVGVEAALHRLLAHHRLTRRDADEVDLVVVDVALDHWIWGPIFGSTPQDVWAAPRRHREATYPRRHVSLNQVFGHGLPLEGRSSPPPPRGYAGVAPARVSIAQRALTAAAGRADDAIDSASITLV